MAAWPRNPVIYEINTWAWLEELRRQYQCEVHLGTIPEQEWVRLASLGIDAVWFMGVWQRSPAGIALMAGNHAIRSQSERTLGDFEPADIIGSPYSIYQYRADDGLGGPQGLLAARQHLATYNIRLVLDFVANHVALDHPWTQTHPDYFIQGTAKDIAEDPGSFHEIHDHILACGRDPYFPAWPDVLQLNAFHPGYRQTAQEILRDIATMCDGVRCDMAMLVMNDIFSRTWKDHAGTVPAEDFWPQTIFRLRQQFPDFLFLAEAYWDMEWRLQNQGFDYCYDKELYDRMAHGDAESIRLHLLADFTYQQKLLRFIENHDEPRAATIFSAGKNRAAAITASTLPGAKLFHEGQWEGRSIKSPIFLRRRPSENLDGSLTAFYQKLLSLLHSDAFRVGSWRLCSVSGWPDNQSCKNLISWAWWREEERYLVVVNFSAVQSQGKIQFPWTDLAEKTWNLFDPFNSQLLTRDGNEMNDPGLFVDLPPWDFHFFRFYSLSLS